MRDKTNTYLLQTLLSSVNLSPFVALFKKKENTLNEIGGPAVLDRTLNFIDLKINKLTTDPKTYVSISIEEKGYLIVWLCLIASCSSNRRCLYWFFSITARAISEREKLREDVREEAWEERLMLFNGEHASVESK